ncbi:MAG: Bug family tripartite tricarboxylate transporter substrate binding protein [Xanthobacteraceae bacterium]
MPCRDCIAAAIVLLALGSAPAAADTYPSKQIRLIVPFTPGSPVDVLARVVSSHLSPRLGQTIVMENKPGAGTTIGTKLAASTDPDGYTLMIAASSLVISAAIYPNPGYDPIKSFAPVAMLARSPQTMVIAPSVPARTVKEFIAYAHANPGKLNFGFGLGTLPQILGEYFKALTKSDIASIPYKGGANAITDMLGGRIQMNFGTPPTLLPLIKQGKIRALAVTTDARYKDLPDVPTMKESGLPQLSLTFTAGFIAPAGTPEPVLRKLNGAVNEALKSPELIAAMAKLGFEPEPWTTKQYADFIAHEVKNWPEIIKASGVKLK